MDIHDFNLLFFNYTVCFLLIIIKFCRDDLFFAVWSEKMK